MNDKLFIAKKIKVGFNPRTDTYTGMLGYVIGHDGKKWRKEPSWEGWRYKYNDSEEFEKEKRKQYEQKLSQTKANTWYKERYPAEYERMLTELENGYDTFQPYGKFSNDKRIIPQEFDNIPTEGFVLNKKVGGTRSNWNSRATYTRVYDPRGFEFEITIPNLLFILQECNAYKGKGLEGTFVYSWDGKDLVLLPTTCDEYQKSQNFTKVQDGKIGVKDLVEGCTYKDKQLNDFIYIGKFNWFENTSNYSTVNKYHIFYSVKHNTFHNYTGLVSFSQRMTDTPVTNYAELLDKFNATSNSGLLTNVTFDEFVPPTTMNYYGHREFPGSALIELEPNTYEVSGNRDDWRNSSNQYAVKSYNLKSTKVVSLNGLGDFKIKKIAPKVIDNVSKTAFKDYNFKALKVNKNNKSIAIEF